MKKAIKILVAVVCLTFASVTPGLSQDMYKFELMWPRLEQPWFSNPSGVAVDAFGNVYVADSGNHRIEKFNLNGYFITEWGSRGSWDGQFYEPSGVAVDNFLLSCLWSFVQVYEITCGNIHFSPVLRRAPTYLSLAD